MPTAPTGRATRARRRTGLCQIAASGGFDHYPTGRGLVILGPTTGSQTQGEASVVRMGHRVWGGCRRPIRAIRLSSRPSHPSATICCGWLEWTHLVRQEGCAHSLATEHRDQCQNTASRFVVAVQTSRLDWIVVSYSRRATGTDGDTVLVAASGGHPLPTL